jgi:hypothetical protein
MLPLKPPARAIENCHQVGNHDNQRGCQQDANHCPQQNVIHAEILNRDIVAHGDSNHIKTTYVSFLKKGDKYRRNPVAGSVKEGPVNPGLPMLIRC